jgi:hypothetical protein
MVYAKKFFVSMKIFGSNNNMPTRFHFKIVIKNSPRKKIEFFFSSIKDDKKLIDHVLI